MKSGTKTLWSSIGAATVTVTVAVALIVVAGSDAPSDPRTQTVSSAFSPSAGANAMVLSVTSDAPQDKRIVTTIARAPDGRVIVGKESTSATDAAAMGGPATSRTTSETVLTLESHPSGTGFTITSQFYDADGAQTGAKVSASTNP